MNRLEAAWQALLAAFDEDPWEGFEHLSEDTESQLAAMRAHDRQSDAVIAALLEECECVAEVFGCEPCVQEPLRAA